MPNLPSPGDTSIYLLVKNEDSKRAFNSACTELCGKQLTREIAKDRHAFQINGLSSLKAEPGFDKLLEKYERFAGNPYVKEIVDWLSEKYKFNPDCLTD